MRNLFTHFLLALAVPLWITAPAAGEEPLASLDGEWEIVGMVHKGKAQKFDGPNGGTMKIKGRELVMRYPYQKDKEGSEDVTEEITLRPEKVPKEIDLHLPLRKEPFLGIYKLEGGTLTIVLAHGDQTRPKEFDATKDANLTSYTLRKARK